MKRFGVSGLALLMAVTLVVTGAVQADNDSKKLINFSIPKISLKKSDCCEDEKECCDKKEACCSAGSKLLSRLKGLVKKAECTGEEDCPVCNAKKLTGKAAGTARILTGKAGEVVKDGADRAKETVGKLRARTEKVIEKIKK